ncbi:MAG: hypothetical protein C4518_04315 [Desulfobacteraceae bacterium]|nr:MAG: hypothetical protein C4518_04315 [Desulfobacteraceae bacterium]
MRIVNKYIYMYFKSLKLKQGIPAAHDFKDCGKMIAARSDEDFQELWRFPETVQLLVNCEKDT